MQHLLAVKRAQASGYLLNDAAHGFQFRLRMIDHPLREGLSVGEFRHHVKVVALSQMQAGFQHMRAVNAPGDPLFHHEPLQVSRIAAQIDRRNLYCNHSIGLVIDR